MKTIKNNFKQFENNLKQFWKVVISNFNKF